MATKSATQEKEETNDHDDRMQRIRKINLVVNQANQEADCNGCEGSPEPSVVVTDQIRVNALRQLFLPLAPCFGHMQDPTIQALQRR